LNDSSGARLQRFLADHGIPLVIKHTSGHASIPDLQRLACAISPHRVVPIHSFGGHRYSELFDSVEVHPDGEWWEVRSQNQK
jgi:ribonuclease J